MGFNSAFKGLKISDTICVGHFVKCYSCKSFALVIKVIQWKEVLALFNSN
jgi:hypothetical protein